MAAAGADDILVILAVGVAFIGIIVVVTVKAF